VSAQQQQKSGHTALIALTVAARRLQSHGKLRTAAHYLNAPAARLPAMEVGYGFTLATKTSSGLETPAHDTVAVLIVSG